jgi:hypothetical protein
MAGFDINFPSKIPQNYALQLSVMKNIDYGKNLVYQFYSKTPITEKMNTEQFFDEGGFWIIYDRIPFDTKNKTESANWISSALSYDKSAGRNATLVTIDGYSAIAYDQHDNYINNEKIHEPSSIELFTNTSRVELEGNLAKESLIDIAHTIR